MAWGIDVEPMTLAVVTVAILFSVANWLRLRSKSAWFDRLLLELDDDE